MKVAIGHDSHRFIFHNSEQTQTGDSTGGSGQAQPCNGGDGGSSGSSRSSSSAGSSGGATGKPLVLGGVVFDGDCPALDGNSDSDVVLHALCNAISGITTVNILGDIADKMCLIDGITDSSQYVKEAMKHLNDRKVVHISLSIECKMPKITPKIPAMRDRISEITGVPASSIGITATSGEELTDFGKGLGIQVFCIVTAE